MHRSRTPAPQAGGGHLGARRPCPAGARALLHGRQSPAPAQTLAPWGGPLGRGAPGGSAPPRWRGAGPTRVPGLIGGLPGGLPRLPSWAPHRPRGRCR